MTSYKTELRETMSLKEPYNPRKKLLFQNYPKNDDIGNKHIGKIKDIGGDELVDEKYFYQFKSIDFSCDILQYLINKDFFNITTDDSTSASSSSSASSVSSANNKKNTIYKLSIENSEIPVLHYIKLYKTSFPNLIVNITIKNVFDSLNFLIPELLKVFRPEAISIDTYNSYISHSRGYYWKIFNDRIDNKKNPISVNDKSQDKFVCPIPCVSNYGLEDSNLKGLSLDIFKNDFIATDYKNVYFYLYDYVMKKYNTSYTPKFSKLGVETFFIKDDGNINKEDIIVFEMPVINKHNSKYLIIGHKYNIYGDEFTKFDLEGYNAVLKDQCENYESWLKEYTFQELKESKPLNEIEFADYILNKKKIANIDFDYMDKMKLLTKEDKDKLMKYLREKINKMCENKFNKPNRKLIYKWDILEVEFEPNSGTEMDVPIKIEYAINNIREVNQNHTVLFEKIQELSRNEMLKKNGIIPDDDKKNTDYKQVFTEIDLAYSFSLVSYYIHPLDYKINYYYRENKIITLEELIECSKLTCDGLYPDMEQYRGLPFYAVVPVEITNYCNILNSANFIVDKGIKCNSTDTTVNTNNTLKKTNMTLSRANTNLNWRSSSSRKSVKSGANPYRSFGKSSAQTRKLANSMANKKNNNTKKNDNSSVLDKTIYIPIPKESSNGTALSNELLNKLFKNPNIKVYSSLITTNGLIFAIFLDMSDKKFYYILMENDLSKLSKSLFETGKINLLKKYMNDGFLDVGIYGTNNIPLLNIYLIKEFTPSDSVFTTLGNECIYKLIGNMHDFFKQPQLKLKYDDTRIDEIPNIYGYMLNSSINMVNSTYDFLKVKLEEIDKSNNTPKIYYRIKEKDDKGNDVYLESSDARINNNNILDLTGKQDVNKRDNNKRIFCYPPITNNNICISIGNNYILILNKYHEDEITTEFIPYNKQQLKNHFKFTVWVFTKEYFNECDKLIKKYKENNTTGKDGDEPQNFFIPEEIKDKILFHITSLNGRDGEKNIIEFNLHIKLLSEFIEKFIIKNDTYLCKSYKPFIYINPLSDIRLSVLHLHIVQDIIHTFTLKLKNIKKELLKMTSSIYDIYTANAYSINKLLNRLICNNNSLYNVNMPNPYLPALKLTYLLNDYN